MHRSARRGALAAVTLAALGLAALTGCSDSGGDPDAKGGGASASAPAGESAPPPADTASPAPQASSDSPAPTPTGTPAGSATDPAAADAKVVKAGLEDGNYVVHWAITNHGGETAAYSVQFEWAGGPRNNDNLGTGAATVTELDPGVTRTGQVMALANQVQGGDVTAIKTVKITQVLRTPR